MAFIKFIFDVDHVVLQGCYLLCRFLSTSYRIGVVVSDIAIFVPKWDVKLQLTKSSWARQLRMLISMRDKTCVRELLIVLNLFFLGKTPPPFKNRRITRIFIMFLK